MIFRQLVFATFADYFIIAQVFIPYTGIYILSEYFSLCYLLYEMSDSFILRKMAKGNSPRVAAIVAPEIKTQIEQLAVDEQRTLSQMAAILLGEALKHRQTLKSENTSAA